VAQQPVLETERLILRPFEMSDAAQVRKLAGDRAIADTTLGIPHPYLEGMAEEWISGHRETYDSGKGATFAVTLKGGGCLVGSISLMSMIPGHQAELGYWIGQPFWNRGYGTEAAIEVARFCFEQLGLKRLHAMCFARNPASAKILLNLGMKHEGRRRRHVRKWDVPEDLDLYGLLLEEWRAKRRQEKRENETS